ncbi:hypothetical protein SNE26_13660 [Mucilaginibacter sp. cycad4]|uniref:hypothetical protein n=1 Tax=Mucilaginibacter sp. cycad4 TaxID=3342096 RepID=UPI002AAB9FDC|nr:hypothetical protein [Mucilaginibacter gossypii]WPV02829.1 hypothetical protein SNE26_13660 [Mucilaginibacter gossypii]
MPPSPQSYNLLLKVFYFGLKWGLVTKADVVKWADDIITAEVEPDYFFIELSMSKDSSEAMALISNETSMDNEPVIGRVLLGLTYYKIYNNTIKLQKASAIMDNIALLNSLTDQERDSLYWLSDGILEVFGPESFENMCDEILAFLSAYKDFTLNNCHLWLSINKQIETHISNIKQRTIEDNEAYKLVQNRINSPHWFTIRMALYVLIIASETVILLQPDLRYKFNKDLYAISMLIFAIAMCYPIVWVLYRISIKLFRV